MIFLNSIICIAFNSLLLINLQNYGWMRMEKACFELYLSPLGFECNGFLCGLASNLTIHRAEAIG